MNPTIISLPTFTITGLLYRSDNKNNEIPQLWNPLFSDHAAEIQHNN